MDRRTFLARGVLALGIGTAASGCTTETLQESEREPPLLDPPAVEDLDLPVRQRLEIAASAIEAADGAGIDGTDEFESFLGDRGLRVKHLGEEDVDGERVVSLEYAAPLTGERGLMDHLGAVAGGYAALVDADHDGERLDATVLDSDGTPYGEYEVRREWAEEYSAGELSARNYAAEVAVTAAATK